MNATKLQYLGHSGFKIHAGEAVVLIDPFLTGNPKAPFGWEEAAKGVTHIVLSHGHADHVGDSVAIAKATGAKVVGMVELMHWLKKQDSAIETIELNLGGGVDLAKGVRATLVQAYHSTGAGPDGVYTGMPAGIVLETPTATIYHAGDTAAFGDMALIHDLFEPDVGLIPIGGKYTMDARAAALVCEHFFEFDVVVPMHYGTFPALAKDAGEFEGLLKAAKCPTEVVALLAGEEIEV